MHSGSRGPVDVVVRTIVAASTALLLIVLLAVVEVLVDSVNASMGRWGGTSPTSLARTLAALSRDSKTANPW